MRTTVLVYSALGLSCPDTHQVLNFFLSNRVEFIGVAQGTPEAEEFWRRAIPRIVTEGSKDHPFVVVLEDGTAVWAAIKPTGVFLDECRDEARKAS